MSHRVSAFFFIKLYLLTYYLASSDYCCLLITFENSLDPVPDRQNVGPDMYPNHFIL